jgi:hypothetical protein
VFVGKYHGYVAPCLTAANPGGSIGFARLLGPTITADRDGFAYVRVLSMKYDDESSSWLVCIADTRPHVSRR